MTLDVPVKGSFRGGRDVPLVLRQVGFEQLSFWLNPIGALMTIVFSVVFLVLLGSTAGDSTVSYLNSIRLVQYYVGAFVGYGIMASCFNVLAINLVNRREYGLLKRLRLSPLPTWMLLAAIFVNSMIVAGIQIVLLLVVGRVGYHVHGPVHVWSFLLLVVVGMLAFTGLGVRHQYAGAERGRGRPGGEPDLLHPGGALGSLLPPSSRLGTRDVLGLLPHTPPHHRPGRRVHRSPGQLALERRLGDGSVGSRRRLRGRAALVMVTPTRLSDRGRTGRSCRAARRGPGRLDTTW
jgi:ABC-2 type transporter